MVRLLVEFASLFFKKKYFWINLITTKKISVTLSKFVKING